MRKAHFYITRLLEKGFTDRDIIAQTRFHPARYEILKRIGTIPTTEEVRKLRSMLILSPEQKRDAAIQIWNQPRVESQKVEEKKPDTPAAPVITEKQMDVVRYLKDGPTPLPQKLAVIAGNLRKNGIVKTKLGENNRRVYELTETGILVLQTLTSSPS